ncbi:MAG: hypothetical protein WBN29_00915, partial [Polyangiales bacterium]
GIEIVSPTFMNQRQLSLETLFIHKVRHATRPSAAAEENRPEERMFDKADIAEKEGKAEEQLKEVLAELEKLKKNAAEAGDPETSQAQIDQLNIRRTALEAEILQHKEQKKKDDAVDDAAEDAADDAAEDKP